jgi:pSer/pThr/pTyr-binding forkhead associated (FHA) protein
MAKTEIIHKPPAVMAWLAIKKGPRAGHLYRLAPDITAIGRDSHNDIIVDDASVSRQHAKVKLEPEGEQKQFYIYDLATANGTFVNGEQVVKEALYDGDEVEIGRAMLVFKQIDGPTRGEEAAAPEDEAGEQEGE